MLLLACSVRSFSVITCRARRQVSASSSSARASKSARLTSRSAGTPKNRAAASHCVRRSLYAESTSPRRVPVSRTTATVPGGRGTSCVSSERQSIRSACPALPAAEIIWSMMPQLTPTHLFSARCPNFAIATASQGSCEIRVKARTVAISSAAEEESPAPIGTSPAKTPSQA